MRQHAGFWGLRVASDEMLHLDALRFIASLGVFMHHAMEYSVPVTQRAHWNERTLGLALFVDMFFAISGFVIAYVYRDRIVNARDYRLFMKRRVARLVPLHWLTLAISILFWIAVMQIGVRPDSVPSFEARCIAYTALLLHSFLRCGDHYFNGVSWSISVEMMMYAVYPLFILFARSLRWGGLVLSGLLLAVTIISHGGFAFNWESVHPLLRGLIAFMAGTSLYELRGKIRVPFASMATLILVVALLASMIFGAPHLISLAIVYFCLVAAIAADRNIPHKWAQLLAPLGQLTYSIYMWHALIILIVLNAFGDKLLGLPTVPMILLTSICLVTTLVGGYLSFAYVETPSRRWIDRLGAANDKSRASNPPSS
jgi:peptidoglycan/LPS O-acetylase OafA/YrhL